MIYNKNEKECWASIATLPSQVRFIIDHNREVVNESDLKSKKPRFEYSKRKLFFLNPFCKSFK